MVVEQYHKDKHQEEVESYHTHTWIVEEVDRQKEIDKQLVFD